ncbi:extracellular solute-binding protein [Enterococcus timonensis]|uniref:extracellular solute-binding protein n=1 Tax=Enterococcus timonensis TaxID=1852364 RepID=UPI0008D916CA|nr:extracellular solute-binding protein [Enterococcus timonensis]
MKNKKILSLLGVGVAAAFILTACGGKDKEAEAANEAVSDEITLMVPFIETTPPEAGNAMQKEIEKYTGKEININWVPNPSYIDKMNITLASDDIPQIIVVQGKDAGFVKSAQNGTFWDLTDKLKDYPNLSQADPEVVQASSLNGTVYGVYRSRDLMRSTVIIRKDWLDNVGLEEPENFEDLYNVAKAFTEEDPDGNGKDDTTGLIIPNFAAAFDMMTIGFGAGNAWTEVDGELVPAFETDEYLEGIQYAKKMVEEGLINKDFATLASDKWDDPFVAGQGGIIMDTYSRAASIRNKMKQADPENGAAKVAIVGNIAADDGTIYAQPTAGYSGFLAVSKASVKNEAQLDDVLTFLDKMNDKDMQMLLNHGIEGVNYNIVDDKYTVAVESDDPEVKAVSDAQKSYSQMATGLIDLDPYVAKPETEADQEFADLRASLEDRDTENAVFNPAAAYVTDTYTSKGAQLDQIITDARVKFIAGQIDEDGWQDAIDLWAKSGGSDLIKETNDLFKADKK